MARRTLLFLLVLSAFARPSQAIVFGLVHAGSVPTGVGCYGVETVDLNGDGPLDVVSAFNDRRGVWMRLERGGRAATGPGIVLP